MAWGGKIRKSIVCRLLRFRYGCSIGLSAKIDDTVLFSHNALGVVVHEHAVIGAHTQIEVNVVIGEKQSAPGKAPVIGSHVHIGAGAVILGNVTVGDNSWIGANAVVTKNVEPNCVVGGVPARIIKTL